MSYTEETLEQNLLSNAPERLVGDGAYDSEPLDERLEDRGIRLRTKGYLYVMRARAS